MRSGSTAETGYGDIDVHCPADGRLVARVPDESSETVAETVSRLRTHQPEWEALGPKGRAQWLRKLRDWLLDNERHLVDVLQSETGKPRAEAAIEPLLACDLINYFADNVGTFLADERVKPHGPLSMTKRLIKTVRPYPVVGVITPWNFPLAMPSMDVIPALLAGAAVLLKPSEVTPLAAVELARGWTDIGAPPVFSVLTGRGDTGAAVVDLVDFVQFTGSTATGRAIAVRAADRLVPCSLELGGKDPAIVLADADLDRAVAGITWGALFNAGQVCVSIERVYVEAPVYDEFVARLVPFVGSLRQGTGGDGYHTDIGALATEAQRDLVARHVDDAVVNGATALTGGKRGSVGAFFEPTVLVDVNHSMACIREETFGPTIPVVKVADAEEAIQLANDSEYGLSATVWCGDRNRGEQIARRLDAGAVNINDAFSNLFALGLPHGGWKQSGLGARFGGEYGIRKYTRQQAITVPRGPVMKRELLWYPYVSSRGRFVGRMLRALVARDLRRRLFTASRSKPL
ncbi:MAG: aldehyde dehydrogenase family protein [Rhodococcus sp. (in: high G+C Gram-positive bacteria)]|uniref:aldehyde dehydrogenase family protein n=1 Tax=Rhodococcus sp. TaxID=1831 RepID=UPI002AD721E0|nr:aldehyde dehydrogenase family protein [Rhodococcus sp. (in: high G+C Gram-positive bacteria)]